MSQSTVQQLPSNTIKLITSTQIVTSVATTVKELIENSIDAGAKVIQVRLENYGLDLIEVKDDGSGVSYDNVQKMFLPGYTSKIKQFEDLDTLHSYGFRGEALAAICKIANVTITTKTASDTLAMIYEIDSTGLPLSSKPSHLNKGTIITVSNLFSNLPVRRLFLSSKKNLSEELKKTEHVVQCLSLIHPELGITIIHNKSPIWRKNSVKGIKQSFMQVAGLKTVSKMDHLHKVSNEVNLDLIVPKKNLENTDNVFTNSQNNVYVYVNKRPVKCKILSQPVQEHVFHHYTSSNISSKYAVCLISINVPPQQIDVNLEPNKTKILLKNQTEVLEFIDEVLKNYYGHLNFSSTKPKVADSEEEVCEEETQQVKRPRLDLPNKPTEEKKVEEHKEKNKDWDVEIILDDCVPNSNSSSVDLFKDAENSHPQSLCSQINSNNCVLTTEEVSEFNANFNDTNRKLLISTNSSNSETRLIDRNDIQSKNTEKPILKEWPCRPKPNITQQTSVESKSNEQEIKSVEEIAKEIERDAEQWSKELGNAMQGNKNEEEDTQQLDLSMQSVSSQMGKKEMKAFTKFARVMRPKIIAEFPNIMFTQISRILADRWKALTPDEVKYYEKMAEEFDVNRKIHQETKQETSNPQEKPKPDRKSNLKLMFENLKKKNKISRPPRKEITVSVSMNKIKKRRQVPGAECNDIFCEIIGKLHPSGNWLYKNGKEIGHVRHQGLRELILSQKMLSSFSVPRKRLEEPIIVNETNLGTVLWNVLISLDSDLEKAVITSDVITKNGFCIEMNKNEDIILSASITETAESIPHFGISALKDVLGMYQKNGEFGGLASWRPTSVCNYINNEAVRSIQQSPQPPNREEIEDMMNTYRLCFRHLRPVCPHSRDIFPSFYDLESKT